VSQPSPDDWYLQPISTIIRRAMAGAAGSALRDMAKDLTAAGASDEVIDAIYARAAAADGIRIVRRG
jgi:hypothetical protein